MIPTAFDYVRAESVDHALAVLAAHGDEAKLLAGGHSLLPLMKLRLAAPAVLVDVGRCGELSYVRDEGDHIAVGALTRHHAVEHDALLRAQVPLLAAAAHEAAWSRVVASAVYPSDAQAGLVLGRAVAAQVIEHARITALRFDADAETLQRFARRDCLA